MTYFVILGRVMECLVALLCLHLAYGLYEDEEGTIQDAFAKAWVRIEDYRSDPSVFARFIRWASQLSLGVISRVFGDEYLSVRFFIPAYLFGLASVSIQSELELPAFRIPPFPYDDALTLLYVVTGLLPAIFNRRWALYPGAFVVAQRWSRFPRQFSRSG